MRNRAPVPKPREIVELRMDEQRSGTFNYEHCPPANLRAQILDDEVSFVYNSHILERDFVAESRLLSLFRYFLSRRIKLLENQAPCKRC